MNCIVQNRNDRQTGMRILDSSISWNATRTNPLGFFLHRILIPMGVSPITTLKRYVRQMGIERYYWNGTTIALVLRRSWRNVHRKPQFVAVPSMIHVLTHVPRVPTQAIH
jgi:hypothetical protein